MSETGSGFEEHWAAHFAREMASDIRAALATSDLGERRRALEAAYEWGKEARVRIQSGVTNDAAEREGLSALERALDGVQAALNRVELGYQPLLRSTLDEAERAGECLGRVGR